MKSTTILAQMCIVLSLMHTAVGAPRGRNGNPCAPITSSFACRRPTADCPCLFQEAATHRESVSYTLKMHLPKDIELTQPWTAFYQGQPIEFDGPSFVWALLPEHATYEHALRDHDSHGDESSGIFSLVITPQVTFVAEGNTIKWLQRIKGQPFRWFDITQDISEGNRQWLIKELPKDEAPLQIPDHAITLLLHPKFIAGLSKPQIPCAQSVFASHFIPLPTINIKTTSEEALNDANAQAALAAVDLRTIHQKQTMQVRQSQKAIVCLTPRCP